MHHVLVVRGMNYQDPCTMTDHVLVVWLEISMRDAASVGRCVD